MNFNNNGIDPFKAMLESNEFQEDFSLFFENLRGSSSTDLKTKDKFLN